MSCQLKACARFPDVSIVKSFFWPAAGPAAAGVQEDAGWDNADWGWGSNEDNDADNDVNAESSESKRPSSGESESDWLQNCHLAISPLGDVLVIGHGDKIAVLQCPVFHDNAKKGDAQSTIVWKGAVTEYPKEEVTSVFCLPLASHKRVSASGADWTCIMVGFNTGYVRMYTETGTLLLNQMLHSEVVMSMKCRTYAPPCYSTSSELLEEFSVLYETAVVIVDGFGLFQTLRGCRNQVARAAASGSDVVHPPPLAYRKWALKEQLAACDHCSAGVCCPTPFDQMQTASLHGFGEQISPTPPTSSIYVSVGDSPYVSFYHAVEGQTHHLLADVAQAASKLLSIGTSALLSWGSQLLSRKKPEHDKPEKPKVEPATPLLPRFCLTDKMRNGVQIALPPPHTSGSIAAVTDSLGRIALVDITRGTVVRMWKGYRNAQVGWVDVQESLQKERGSKGGTGSRRRALFLVIYAPRRGLLEVWLSQMGPRVAAFNVGKNCQLLYPGCGMLGLNSATYQSQHTDSLSCCLLDSSGNMFLPDVPFHLALSDANSRRAHDQHVLRQLQSTLKRLPAQLSAAARHNEADAPAAAAKQESSGDAAELAQLSSLLDSLKLASSKQQAIDAIIHADCLSTSGLKDVLNQYDLPSKAAGLMDRSPLKVTADYRRQDSVDLEARLLSDFCHSQLALLACYEGLVDKHRGLQLTSATSAFSTEPDRQPLLPLTDAEHSLDAADRFRAAARARKRVQFTQQPHMAFTRFATCFQASPAGKVSPAKEWSPEDYADIGLLVLKPFVSGLTTSSSLRDAATSLGLVDSADLLLNMLLCYCFHPDDPVSRTDVTNLRDVLEVIHDLSTSAVAEELPEQYRHPATPAEAVSPLWSQVRDACESALNYAAALQVAVASRSVCAAHAAGHRHSSPTGASSEPASEQSKTAAAAAAGSGSLPSDVGGDWEHLTMDVALWNACIKRLEDLAVLNEVLLWRPNKGTLANVDHIVTVTPISVQGVRRGNKGIIAELIGQWCVSNRLEPADFKAYDSASATTTSGIDALSALKAAFPRSLTPDILHANCSWEYAALWAKDVEALTNFRMALAFLRAVQNAVCQHGICVLMWTVFFEKKLAALSALMEKVGKSPKDRLCKKEIGMDTASATEFVGLACEFFTIFMQANCDFGEHPALLSEEAWDAESCSSRSLVDMATRSKETNYLLLRLHYVLLVCMHAILTFGLKSVRPLSLFDQNSRNAFFLDLHSRPYFSTQVKDGDLMKSRQAFISHVLSGIACSLPISTNLTSQDQLVRSPRLADDSNLSTDTLRWPSLLEDIASDLNIKPDAVRAVHVRELYSAGRDELAEEVLLTVHERRELSLELLAIAGGRVAQYLSSCNTEKAALVTSKMSPTLTSWLRSVGAPRVVAGRQRSGSREVQQDDELQQQQLTQQQRDTPPPLLSTVKLLSQVVRSLPEEHATYGVALELAKAGKTLL